MVAGIIAAIFTGIDDAIDTLNENTRLNIQKAASDPCYAEVEMRGFFTEVMDPKISNIQVRINDLARDSRAAVRLSIQRWGRPDTSYSRSDRFADYLIENGAIPIDGVVAAGAALSGSPMGAAIAHGSYALFVDQSMPGGDGRNPPSGTNGGFRLGPGAYLYPNVAGELRGSKVRRLYFDWLRQQKARVVPADAPEWRDSLARLVGVSRDDWTIWRPGDPIAPTSRLGDLLRRREEARILERQFRAECRVQRAHARAYTDREQMIGGIQRLTPIAAVVVGGAVALLFVGRR